MWHIPGWGMTLGKKHAWFDELVAATSRRLTRHVGGILSCPDDVQEVVQEAYLKVFLQLRREDLSEHNPVALLYTTARNLAISRIRHQKVLARTETAVLVSEELRSLGPSPEKAAGTELRTRSLMAVVNSLPPRCRSVLTLRLIEDLSHRDISERLGITVSTVEKHLAAGLRICRERLGAAFAQEFGVGQTCDMDRTGT